MPDYVAKVKGWTLLGNLQAEVHPKGVLSCSLIISQRACPSDREAYGHKAFCSGRDTALLGFYLLIAQAGEQPYQWENTRQEVGPRQQGKGEDTCSAKNCPAAGRQHLTTLGKGKCRLLGVGTLVPQEIELGHSAPHWGGKRLFPSAMNFWDHSPDSLISLSQMTTSPQL